MSATIISLLPFDLVENKPGLTPNEYIVNGMKDDKPGITVFKENTFYMVNPDPLSDAKEVRFIKVPVPAFELAKSIISDYVVALLGAAPPDSVPGLIPIEGEYTIKEAGIKFLKEIMMARKCQNRWFSNLIDIADDTWSKSKSPVGISDLQRVAVKALGYNREWLNPIPLNPDQIVKCPFCQNVINPGAIKCLSCGEILDKKKYNELVGVH